MRSTVTAALILSACSPCNRPTLVCAPAPVMVLEGGEDIPASWTHDAMATAYHRVGDKLACHAMRGVEVWLRYHRGDPMVCAEFDYGSCAVRISDRVYAVEVDVSAVRPGGAESVYEIIHHELTHVVLRCMGVPGREHHQMMGSWHIETTNRRRTP